MQGDSKKAVLLLTLIKKIQDKEKLKLSSAGVERMNNYLINMAKGRKEKTFWMHKNSAV